MLNEFNSFKQIENEHFNQKQFPVCLKRFKHKQCLTNLTVLNNLHFTRFQ